MFSSKQLVIHILPSHFSSQQCPKVCVIPPIKQLAIITQWIIIALQNLSNQESTTLLWTRWLDTYLPTEFHSWTLVSSFTLFHITSSKSSSWHQAVEDDVKSTMSGDDVIEVPRFWFGSLGLGPYIYQPNHHTKVVIGCCWVWPNCKPNPKRCGFCCLLLV